jgi:hypothetical protein
VEWIKIEKDFKLPTNHNPKDEYLLKFDENIPLVSGYQVATIENEGDKSYWLVYPWKIDIRQPSHYLRIEEPEDL